MSEMEELRAWERKDDEPDNCYRAFLCWRDQRMNDPRSRNRTMLETYRRYVGDRDVSRTPPFFFSWRDDYDWTEHARAWDRYIQRREDDAHASGREAVARERGASLADVESRQLEALYMGAQKVIDALNDPAKLEEFMPKDYIALLRGTTEAINVLAKYRSLKPNDESEEPLTEEEEKFNELMNKLMQRDEED